MTRNSDVSETLAARFSQVIKSGALGVPHRFESEVGSTNDLARLWANDGGPHGALVFAESQTHGRGRHGRSWQAQAGLNLTFSLILRPDLPPGDFPLLALAAGLALQQTIEGHCPMLNVQIKWPNDVLIDDRKCAGILLESSIGAGSTENIVILGIGLNINQISFSRELEGRATSVLLETGRPQDRLGMLVDLLKELGAQIARLSQGKTQFLRSYESHLFGIGSVARLKTVNSGPAWSGPAWSGTILGVTDDGSLRIKTDSGTQIVYAGEVTFEEVS